jgi:hypothetical protein
VVELRKTLQKPHLCTVPPQLHWCTSCNIAPFPPSSLPAALLVTSNPFDSCSCQSSHSVLSPALPSRHIYVERKVEEKKSLELVIVEVAEADISEYYRDERSQKETQKG